MPLHARVTAEAVREQLAAEGYLRADKRRALGLFPTVEYALERVAAVDALREEARQVLEGPVRPADVSDRDAAVVVLAAAAGVSALVARKERGQHKERLADLWERSGTAAPGLRKIMDELGTALTATAAPTGV